MVANIAGIMMLKANGNDEVDERKEGESEGTATFAVFVRSSLGRSSLPLLPHCGNTMMSTVAVTATAKDNNNKIRARPCSSCLPPRARSD
eukprot:8678261-Ditylum_brightwellii.AAC.1